MVAPAVSSPPAGAAAARPEICTALFPIHASRSKDTIETRIEAANLNAVMAHYCGFKP